MKNCYFNDTTKKQVAIVLRVGVKLHRQAEFKELVKDLVTNSRAEAGCLSYNVYHDIDNPETFIFHEVWESMEDFEEHKISNHFKYYAAKKTHLASRLYAPGIFERSEAPMPKSSPGSLVLFAKIKALDGKETELEGILCDLIAPTVAEDGCEHYELHKSQLDSQKFLYHETWTTVPHWDVHMQTKHITDLLEILGNYVDGEINVTKTEQIF